MYPTTLRQLLGDPAFAPGQIRDAPDVSDQWFATAAEMPSFAFRSIFRDLIDRGFTSQQGVSTADRQLFVTDVLPPMLAALAVLPADPVADLRALVLAYHTTL